MSIPYFWSNLTMQIALVGVFIFGMWIFFPSTRIEGKFGTCCSFKCRSYIEKRVTPQLRRVLTSLLILLYSLVARTSIDSLTCIDDGNGTMVQSSNVRVICWQNEHHYKNGVLGIITIVFYIIGLPFFFLWMTTKGELF